MRYSRITAIASLARAVSEIRLGLGVMTSRMGWFSADPSSFSRSRRRSPSEKIPLNLSWASTRMTAPLRRLMVLTSCSTWPTVS